MSQNIVLKKGLDVPITGAADLRVAKTMVPDVVAVKPTDFKGFAPRLLVKEGDRVLCGSPVLADKKNPDILIASPVSGTVRAIVRGDKRKLLAVLIDNDGRRESLDFGKCSVKELDAAQIREKLLASGVWPWIIQRPYGILADPAATPKAVFISAFDSAPLAPDYAFTLGTESANIQTGIDALARLTGAPVHIGLPAVQTPFDKLENVRLHRFQGKHPAGNVGVQISHIDPICKGETVWTTSLLGLAIIGRLMNTGRYNALRKLAVTGPMAIEAAYVETVPGTSMKDFAPYYGADPEGIRFVDGNVLTGENVGADGYLGYFSQQLTLLREGVEPELLGWIRPIRYRQFSTDHSYFSWLMPWRKYDMDTNLHGGARAFLMNDGYYAKVLPMDIYPIFLAKACLAGDIDKMEKFGIYEVLPEDLATCEFVDPSKNNIQEMIAQGIDLMLTEMA
ncbi:MAG: Na(+)-translocating NADH-quinone reductase subunit A [Bacteroidales bacterium]|nr:Na(+)-translocating NADH-quinone reductase subunit A [Bacteroidales bacterium]